MSLSTASASGCCDRPAPTPLLPVDDAIARLQAAGSAKLPPLEVVDLQTACGRVLAADLYSAVDVPPRANSAMDGYALRTADLGALPCVLPISQRIAAGHAPQPLQPGSAARIFTGAEIPEGADLVVMQEDCDALEGAVRILQAGQAGDNIRPAGQDIQQGGLLLRVGDRLTPAAIGLLATAGLAKVPTYRPLRVAVLSTGDELVEPGQPLQPGQIYNSNRALLLALLPKLGCVPVDAGIVPDNLPATLAALRQLAGQVDVILSSGGVSVGEEDHVKAALQQCGELDLWKVAIKPGKPLAFGRAENTAFIGLPGNPQSVWVTFLILARQYLLTRQGQRQGLLPRAVPLPADFAVRKAQGRREYLRVQALPGERGWSLQRYPNQSSGVLSSAVWADGFAIVDAGVTINQGDTLPFVSFFDLQGA